MSGGVVVAEEREVIKDDAWHRAQSMFATVDTDGSGQLDRDEVRKLGDMLGTPMVESELDAAMRAMDGDGSGEVDFDEFYEWWKVVSKREEEGKAVWSAEPEPEPEPEPEEVQPASPSAPASPAPQRGSGRRAAGSGSPPAPPGKPPERGTARRTQRPVAPLNLDVGDAEPAVPTAPESDTAWSVHPLLQCCRRRRKKTPREECRELFDEVDDDGSGLLDVGEIVKLARLLGVSLNPAQCKEAMDEMDDDGSGEVDFEEFFQWWERTSGSEGRGHCDSDLGKASLRWAEHEHHRAVIRATAQRNSSILSHAIAGQRTVAEMRASHALVRDKEA
jgi:Ca2+-binding EF-hand superfamily protein